MLSSLGVFNPLIFLSISMLDMNPCHPLCRSSLWLKQELQCNVVSNARYKKNKNAPKQVFRKWKMFQIMLNSVDQVKKIVFIQIVILISLNKRSNTDFVIFCHRLRNEFRWICQLKNESRVSDDNVMAAHSTSENDYD